MSTKVYGASDDLIEFEGDVYGEVGAYGTDKDKNGVLLVFSDGTILEAKYGKCEMAIWGLTVIRKGSLLENIEQCEDENAKPHSDVAKFYGGLNWAYAARNFERVK